MPETLSQLEAEALKRKERLLSMKRKFVGGAAGPGTSSGDSVSDTQQTDETVLKKPAFRSYDPEENSLKELQRDKAKPIHIEENIQEHLAAGRDLSIVDEIDLTKLQPRKIDWDLKRDIAPKLQKLERRTQRAIAELIRERLASGKGDDNLFAAVNSGAQPAPVLDDED